MKLNTLHIVALGLTISLVGTSCDSFDNPNAATESQVLTTVDGLTALAIGMKREYQVNTLDVVIRSSGLSAREFGVVVGFTNPQDLEAVVNDLPESEHEQGQDGKRQHRP